MRKRLVCLLLAAVFLLCGCATSGAARAAAADEKETRVGFYFDTVVTLTLYGAEEGLADELLAECGRYEQLLSKTIAGSDVDRINRANGETVTVDEETWTILRRAKEISDLTEHAFSVTVAPLTALWDFTGGTNRMPTDEERLAALPLVDDDAMVLGDGFTVTMKPGMEVDLGGIAKGYIADMLAEKTAGRVTGATLNFGGNVYAVGRKPDGSDFRLGINDPFAPEQGIIGVLTGHDITVVTSGTYERYFEKDGVRYHHILDPDTGISAQTDLVSVTIVGTGSMDADAYATACIVLGKEKALALLNEKQMDAVLVDQDGMITLTEHFLDHYPSQWAEPSKVR